jgi:hypothetical protein
MKRFGWLLALLMFVLIGPSLLAQATSQALGQAATPTGPVSEWGNTAIWAFLSTSGLEWLKRHPSINFISERTAFWVQRSIGAILAIAAAGGVHASFDAATGTLAVTGLIWSSISEAFGDCLRQFVANEFVYRVAVKDYKGNT